MKAIYFEMAGRLEYLAVKRKVDVLRRKRSVVLDQPDVRMRVEGDIDLRDGVRDPELGTLPLFSIIRI